MISALTIRSLLFQFVSLTSSSGGRLPSARGFLPVNYTSPPPRFFWSCFSPDACRFLLVFPFKLCASSNSRQRVPLLFPPLPIRTFDTLTLTSFPFPNCLGRAVFFFQRLFFPPRSFVFSFFMAGQLAGRGFSDPPPGLILFTPPPLTGAFTFV